MKFEDSQPISPASFYKFITLGTISQEKLMIPDKFASTYGDELSGDISLIIPDGYIWPVKLQKSDNGICFSDGWPKMVHHYSISNGNIILFKYTGNSCFNLFIYDKTSNEIDYSSHAFGSSVGPNSDEEQELSESDFNGLASSMKSQDYFPGNSERGGKKMKTSLEKGKQFIPETVSALVSKGKDQSDGPITSEEEAAKLGVKACFIDFLTTTLLTTQEKKRAILAAREFSSENPCFMAVIRHCNLHRYIQMDAPVDFSATCLLPARSVELEIADGRRWTVYSKEIKGGLGKATLKIGWANFAKANQLEIGDICIFEAIRVDNVVIRVTIFRGNHDV